MNGHWNLRKAAARSLKILNWEPENISERAHFLFANENWEQFKNLGGEITNAVLKGLLNHELDFEIRDRIMQFFKVSE